MLWFRIWSASAVCTSRFFELLTEGAIEQSPIQAAESFHSPVFPLGTMPAALAVEVDRCGSVHLVHALDKSSRTVTLVAFRKNLVFGVWLVGKMAQALMLAGDIGGTNCRLNLYAFAAEDCG
jgi:hypothetical protein